MSQITHYLVIANNLNAVDKKKYDKSFQFQSHLKLRAVNPSLKASLTFHNKKEIRRKYVDKPFESKINPKRKVQVVLEITHTKNTDSKKIKQSEQLVKSIHGKHMKEIKKN